MVGTIEPRKNHRQVFEAFDSAWQRGLQAQLVIVGARAWKTEELLAEMQSHPEFDKRFHLVRDASDVDLDFLYRRATALIIASEVEGFGLPIVEARQRGLRVIASDIPVFREIEDPATLFFALGNVESLVERLLEVAGAGKQTMHGEGSRWMTWRESTEELLFRVEELMVRLPTAAHSQRTRASRMSRLLLRLRAWSRRSRVIVTSEGSVPSDPYDPGYALLSVQAKRIALARLVGELQAGPPRRWPKIGVCILMRYFDLRLSVTLANALIAERNLARISTGKRVGANEAGHRKA
jgi:glycosyltransferase involved in cell wall biosynthesis